MKTLSRSDVVLEGNPARVLLRMFVPGEEELIRGQSRIPQVVERCLALPESEIITILKRVTEEFSDRHRNLLDEFHTHFHAVRNLTDESISQERELVIGAYLSQEYAIEGAAYFNPSIVPFPHTSATSDEQGFVLSVRAVGEGHISTIVFRTGALTSRGIHIDPASPFATTRAHRYTVLRNRMVRQEAEEAGVATGELELALGLLPDKFTVEDLTAALTQLDTSGLRRAPSEELAAVLNGIALNNYEVDFDAQTDLSERVLWPTAASERRGMEDARFTEICEDDCARYRATYTGFDGTSVVCRALETDDFRTFSSMQLTGPGAMNKGLAFFPRRIDGRYVALSRFDAESQYISLSDDGYHWNDVHPLSVNKSWWELVHVGNCGAPIETDEGWLVLTHGAGPMRRYCLGALLLDKEDPTVVRGSLNSPLLEPTSDERNGYVPNVVYSCGSLVHNNLLVIPYGFSDWKIHFATLELNDLFSSMT